MRQAHVERRWRVRVPLAQPVGGPGPSRLAAGIDRRSADDITEFGVCRDVAYRVAQRGSASLEPVLTFVEELFDDEAHYGFVMVLFEGLQNLVAPHRDVVQPGRYHHAARPTVRGVLVHRRDHGGQQERQLHGHSLACQPAPGVPLHPAVHQHGWRRPRCPHARPAMHTHSGHAAGKTATTSWTPQHRGSARIGVSFRSRDPEGSRRA
jgi:hypothetical protein